MATFFGDRGQMVNMVNVTPLSGTKLQTEVGGSIFGWEALYYISSTIRGDLLKILETS